MPDLSRKDKMKNAAKCRLQNTNCKIRRILTVYFSLCILNFALASNAFAVPETVGVRITDVTIDGLSLDTSGGEKIILRVYGAGGLSTLLPIIEGFHRMGIWFMLLNL